MRAKYIAIIILILSFCALLSASGGEKFPDFKLKGLDSKDNALSTVLEEGKPVVLSFWATWCKPCCLELDRMKPIFEGWDNSVNYIAISEDGPKSKSKVAPLVKKQGYPYTVVFDDNGELKKKAGVSDIPALFILDTTGKVLYRHSGFKAGDENKIKAEVEKVLKSCSDGVIK
jgi:peroxiredoxin